MERIKAVRKGSRGDTEASGSANAAAVNEACFHNLGLLSVVYS